MKRIIKNVLFVNGLIGNVTNVLGNLMSRTQMRMFVNSPVSLRERLPSFNNSSQSSTENITLNQTQNGENITHNQTKNGEKITHNQTQNGENINSIREENVDSGWYVRAPLAQGVGYIKSEGFNQLLLQNDFVKKGYRGYHENLFLFGKCSSLKIVYWKNLIYLKIVSLIMY